MSSNVIQSGGIANVTLVTTAETVLRTLSGVSTGRKVNVGLKGWVQLTTGAGTTAVTLRIRRGTDATGTLIGEATPVTVAAAAGSTELFDIETFDPGADLASATYVLTAEQTGATANGTALQSYLEADIPN